MADESVAVTTAREFREQLLRQEDAALREMSRAWVRMEDRLVDEWGSRRHPALSGETVL